MSIPLEDLDARDTIAEDVFTVIIRSGNFARFEDVARIAYNAAEAFLAERRRRLDEERAEMRRGSNRPIQEPEDRF